MIISNNINYNNNYNFSINKGLTPKFNSIGLKTDTVSFKKNDQPIEMKFKRISGLHDPYSKIVMVSDDDYAKYLRKISKRPNAETMINLLESGYKENLFEPEATALSMISDYYKDLKKRNINDARNKDLHDICKALYVPSKLNLAKNQLKVVDELNSYISLTKGSTNDILTNIIAPVEDSIRDDSFRISPLIKEVYEAKGLDKTVKKTVLKIMENFPNSRNSADVFIINNAHKSHEDIASAFLDPSRVSIEHIKPQSNSGHSDVCNYLIASKRMNNLKSNIPLSRFIDIHPDIPNNMQKYFDDIISKVNKGGLSYITIALPDLTATIEKESKGKVLIDLDNLSLKEVAKASYMKQKISELISHFQK